MSVRLLHLLLFIVLTSCTTVPDDTVPDPADGSVVSVPMQAQSLPQEQAMELPLAPLQVPEQQYANDVWQLIRQQSHLAFPSHDPAIAREIRFYADKQSFFTQVASAANPYLFHIVNELEKRNMPLELALLPVVESAYNSAAQGAGPAGLWQLVPQTARNFGLTVQAGYDGRKNAIASTDAVLDYLQHLYDTLEHDWLNAVAAYNTGENRIAQAIARNKAQKRPTDFWHLNIPAHYTRTVPRWLAIVEIVRNPKAHQIELPTIALTPQIGQSWVQGSIDLRQAATVAGITYPQLKQLNPAFKQRITPAKGQYPLLLPYSQVAVFEQAKASLKEVSVAAARTTVGSETQTYQVKSGDTLSSIAKKFHTQVATLKKLNRLKTAPLKVGQVLQLSDPTHIAAAKTNKNKATPKKSTTTIQPAVRYQVAKGDSLSSIAKRHQVSVAQLRQQNRLAKDVVLQLGQILIINKSDVNKALPSNKKLLEHQVKSGDSLDRIARRYQLKLSDLLQWNQLRADTKLMPGQRLRLQPGS